MATVAKNTRSTTIVPSSDTAGPFTLTFRLFDTDAVKVYVDGKPVIGWSLSATFTNGYADGATITFPAPILSGSTIIIDAALVPWRADDLINGDLNIVSRLNNELGRIWATLGELRRDTDRSVRVFDPVDPVGDFDLLNIANAAEAAALAKSAADAAAASAAAASAFDPANFATSAQGTKADNAIPALAQAQVTDFNAVDTTRSGQYWAANTATNGPGVSEDFAVTYTRRDAASGHAMIISTQTGRLFVRRRRASVWGAWIEFPNSLAIIEAADANNATKSGFHRLQNTCANLPAAGTYECIVSAPNVTDIAQIAIRATDGASWRRTKTAGAWGAWVLGIDANNIGPYIGTTAAIQNTTSGTAFDFTGIPAGVSEIEVLFDGVSLSGTDQMLVQIGPAGGVETTGYVSASGDRAVENTATAGFVLRTITASEALNGIVKLTAMDAARTLWISSHAMGRGTAAIFGGGSKVIAAALTQLRVTRTGTNTFDAGAITIRYR